MEFAKRAFDLFCSLAHRIAEFGKDANVRIQAANLRLETLQDRVRLIQGLYRANDARANTEHYTQRIAKLAGERDQLVSDKIRHAQRESKIRGECT